MPLITSFNEEFDKFTNADLKQYKKELLAEVDAAGPNGTTPAVHRHIADVIEELFNRTGSF